MKKKKNQKDELNLAVTNLSYNFPLLKKGFNTRNRMIRIQRLVAYILSLVLFLLITITLLPHLENNTSQVITTSPKKYNPHQERYLSWFPHR